MRIKIIQTLTKTNTNYEKKIPRELYHKNYVKNKCLHVLPPNLIFREYLLRILFMP